MTMWRSCLGYLIVGVILLVATIAVMLGAFTILPAVFGEDFLKNMDTELFTYGCLAFALLLLCLPKWIHNLRFPVRRVDAVLVSRGERKPTDSDGQAKTYEATFRLESGEFITLTLSAEDCQRLTPGVRGKLTYQRTVCQSFQPNSDTPA